MIQATGNTTVISRTQNFLSLLERCQRQDGYLGAWADGARCLIIPVNFNRQNVEFAPGWCNFNIKPRE